MATLGGGFAFIAVVLVLHIVGNLIA